VTELRILAGHPTAEELAAVTVVLMAAGARRTEPAAGPVPVSRWRLSARPGVPGRAGAGAWRASALPTR
jgi:hypothetical protein